MILLVACRTVVSGDLLLDARGPIDLGEPPAEPLGLASGDLNCDDRPDVAVGLLGSDEAADTEVALLYADADGVPRDEGYRLDGVAGTVFGRSLAIADFDDDGCDDLAVGASSGTATKEAAGAVFVYAGREGGLAAEPDLTLGPEGREEAYGMAIAAGGDADGDGRADLVIAGTLSGDATLWVASWPDGREGPCGQFTEPDLLVPRWLGDLDGDGHDDFGAVDVNTGDLRVCSGGEVDRGFAWAVAVGSVGLEPLPVVAPAPAGDVDGDGVDDLALLHTDEDPAWTVSFYAGSAEGPAPSPFASSTEAGDYASPLGFTGGVVFAEGGPPAVAVWDQGDSGRLLALTRGGGSPRWLATPVVADGYGDGDEGDPVALAVAGTPPLFTVRGSFESDVDDSFDYEYAVVSAPFLEAGTEDVPPVWFCATTRGGGLLATMLAALLARRRR